MEVITIKDAENARIALEGEINRLFHEYNNKYGPLIIQGVELSVRDTKCCVMVTYKVLASLKNSMQ